ncbi:microtubule-associated protein Jupiter isoform X10 [Zeugodacus cucurbitae]|uniref:microtubule-associated protein Jupiter isoform X10 n=1 Tax=Zeugodacus cucurbitae TaxID=28588 RepID=UPI0010A74471|nr:microtubule-associated protein Jupiter isoform X10 [Zeugodacus cucurbitae]
MALQDLHVRRVAVPLFECIPNVDRVLRPPGGGTSDIFGGDLPQTPRNVKNHMQSNIFSCDKNGAIKNNGDQPRRGQQKVDSYQRLFGEPERPNTPARNHMKSSIPFGSNTEAAQELLANGNGHGHHSNGKGGSVSTSTSSSVSSSTENLKMNGVSKLDGNPVTGEGYKPSNSFNNAVPSLNGANQVINKNRIPPGGFSSGLW